MNEFTVYEILDRVYYILDSCMLLPIVIATFRIRYLSKSDKYVFGLLICIFLLEIISETLRWSRIRNHFINYPISFCLFFFTVQFFAAFKEPFFKQKYLLIGLFFIFVFIEVLIVGFNQINSLTLAFAYFQMFIFGIRYLQKYFSVNEVLRHLPISSFWFSVSFSVWGAFAFLPSLLQRYFIETSIPLYYFFDTVRMLGFAMSCIIFAIGFSKLTKTNKA